MWERYENSERKYEKYENSTKNMRNVWKYDECIKKNIYDNSTKNIRMQKNDEPTKILRKVQKCDKGIKNMSMIRKI